MSGIVWSLVAGVGFGVFQAVNRRINANMDAYRATFSLLLLATVGLATIAGLTRDLSVLSAAPMESYLWFFGAGIVHFFFGWTFLAISQQRVGASRTGATIAATPLIGSILAVIVLDEAMTAITLLGVLMVVGGVMVLALRGGGAQQGIHAVPWFGLLASLSWGTSPLFIRLGLVGLAVPLIGVTIGLASATAAYGVALTVTKRWNNNPYPWHLVRWILLAAFLVASAIASQWIAFDLIEVAVAITLMQVSTPVVILLAPLVVGAHGERITPGLLFGTALVMAGSIAVVLA